MIKLKLIFLLALLISQIDFGLCEDDDEEEDHNTKSSKGDDDEGSGEAKGVNLEFQKKYEKIKNDKSKGLKGHSGKIYAIVVETIKEINPIRLLMEFNPEIFLRVNGIDFEKFKFPVNYFSEAFWTKFAGKVKMGKKEISKEIGGDIEKRPEGAWISLGNLLKLGTKKKISVGDYLQCLGLDLEPYEKKYDDYMIESVRVPVQFIDEIMTEGFDKYIKLIKDFVSANGGPMNAALKAYSDYSGRDVAAETRKSEYFVIETAVRTAQFMIKRMKSFNVSNEFDFGREKYEKAWKEYHIVLKKQMKMYYNFWFGKGGRFYLYQHRFSQKMAKILNKFTKMEKEMMTGGKMKEYLDLAGSVLGAEGRAIVYIVYQPTATMFNQIFGPMLVIPRIMATDADLWDKVLALPPVIIQTSGGLFKPLLMVFEPLLRLLRFLVTGQYGTSLNCGLDLSAAYGISIWGGAFKPRDLTSRSKKAKEQGPAKGKDQDGEPKEKPKKEAKPKRRSKRDAEEEKEESPEEASRYTQSDKKLADSYQGGPPPGGYKLGIKFDGKIDLDDEDFISRLLLSPDFILKAGGPVYVPFASVLAPFLRTMNVLLFGEEEFNQRMAQIPDIIRGVGVIGPLSDIVQSALPFIKTGYLIYHGKLTSSDIIVQTPSLVKQATNGVLYGVYKNPAKLQHAMLSFLDGHGGILAMLRLQSRYDVPQSAPGATRDVLKEFGEEGNFIVTSLGEFFGGWFLTYFQAVGPVGSFIGTWFNGVLGNIIAPVKFLDTGIDLKHQPLKTVLEAMDDLPRLLKAAEDKRTVLSALLGGQDPDVLKEIGIDCEKLAANGIDPGLLLAAGKKLLPSEIKKKLESGGASIGLDAKLMVKVDLKVNTVIESGLLDANQEKLLEMGIDTNTVVSRALRGSIQDDILLMNAGISIKTMLKAGICPSTFLAGGVNAVPDQQLKAAGVNKNQLSDENLRKLGLNPAKLKAKGIDAKKLATDGLQSYSKMQGTLGINIQVLMFSVYHGMDQKRMLKAGINLNTMLKAGIDTRLLLVGGLREALKNDISEAALAKVGIDAKQILKMGININLLADVGAAVLNPLNLNKMAIDPMSVIIAGLSRRGLDVLTGGAEDATSVSFGFVASLLKITHNSFKLIPRLRDLPFGKNIVGPDGRFTGIPGFFFYKILSIDSHGGMLGYLRKVFSGKFTKAEIMEMINPIRLAFETANPEKKPRVVTRSKENRKSVDDYKQQAVALRVGPSRNTGGSGGGSTIFGRSKGQSSTENPDNVYDERQTTTEGGGEEGGEE